MLLKNLPSIRIRQLTFPIAAGAVSIQANVVSTTPLTRYGAVCPPLGTLLAKISNRHLDGNVVASKALQWGRPLGVIVSEADAVVSLRLPASFLAPAYVKQTNLG